MKQAEIICYVKTCDPCHMIQNVQPYVTNRFAPHSRLFEVFYIDFAVPLTL